MTPDIDLHEGFLLREMSLKTNVCINGSLFRRRGRGSTLRRLTASLRLYHLETED